MTYEEARATRRNTRAAQPVIEAPAPVAGPVGPTPAQLEVAGREFARRCSMRADSFANNSSEACFDIAAKLARFGSYASQKQADYAAKLVGWAAPRDFQQVSADKPAVVAPQAAPVRGLLNLPATAALFAPDRFSRFSVGPVSLSRSNDGALVWIKFAGHGKVVGKLDVATASTAIFSRIDGEDRDTLLRTLVAIEADPKGAAAADGIRTGRCSCCGRELTDPVSIGIGIGPICLGKLG